ncbi:MAG: hypothetical protein Ct9H300mP16_12050 [Pseudomonadota bacterium]|nr:MAG: hypothetical protein Ct9H300mP16_12050 [Pseudomonadota bacterium]
MASSMLRHHRFSNDAGLGSVSPAGIKFWDCAHECNAGMSADGYTRATGKMCMAFAQNGPGITNLSPPSPLRTGTTHRCSSDTPGSQKDHRTGGLSGIKQMAAFENMVCYQEEVRDPPRITEVLNR